MGMFDKWFGGAPDYPPLPADNEARAKLDEVMAPLEELAEKVHDHLEVVPAEHEAYVYLGKPPKRFGIAWVHDGKLDGLPAQVRANKADDILGNIPEIKGLFVQCHAAGFDLREIKDVVDDLQQGVGGLPDRV